MEHVKFHYRSLEDIRQEEAMLGVEFPLSEDVSCLERPLTVGSRRFANRLMLQPMEGCDSTPDGRPGELMIRRYKRYAASGAGLIWVEATAVVPEARATPGQMVLCEENLDDLKRLVETIRETAAAAGRDVRLILQATHSGRYSKPHGYPEPIIAYNNPIFEKDKPIPAERIITDDELKRIEELYGKAAVMAKEIGYDGIDVKACHRYLNCELLSAFTRPGLYGGSFENRTRFFRNAFSAARAAVPEDFIVTTRMNLYDGFPYPYGWGVMKDGSLTPDMTEPLRLVADLRGLGLKFLNITMGNPYVNPHVNRPYDIGGYVPPEHPLEGIARMYRCTAEIAEANPELPVIFSGPSYLRAFAANYAAGIVEKHPLAMVGFGREGFAYPDFAGDILDEGAMNPRKVCVSCGKCAELLRNCYTAGCVVRDPLYTEVYKKEILKNG